MSRDNSYLIGNQFARDSGGNETSFKKGHQPWNKGLKGWSPEGSKATQFKRGFRSSRCRPVGSVTVRIDKSKKQRRWIKVTDTGKPQDWVIYATWLWEKNHGPIPKGMMVHHLDHDSMNDTLSNYALITRSGHINEHRAELIEGRKRNGGKVGKGYIRRGC